MHFYEVGEGAGGIWGAVHAKKKKAFKGRWEPRKKGGHVKYFSKTF